MKKHHDRLESLFAVLHPWIQTQDLLAVWVWFVNAINDKKKKKKKGMQFHVLKCGPIRLHWEIYYQIFNKGIFEHSLNSLMFLPLVVRSIAQTYFSAMNRY